MKFYYAPGTVARATFIALEEAEADYRCVRVEFSKGDQNSTTYRKVNPKGRVPALITDEGVLTETPAMLAFVAQLYPEAGLAPLDDPFTFAQVQSFNNYICATLHVAHAHRVRGSRWADEDASLLDMQNKVPQTVGECFRYIEDQAFIGPYVMGENYTICDPYLYTVSGWMEGDGIDIKAYPNIHAHRKMMDQRAAVQRVLELETTVG